MDDLLGRIIDWFGNRSGDAVLQEQLRSARVVRCDYVRTGYFVYFSVPEDAPLAAGVASVPGPDIVGPELLDGAGTTVFCRDGRLHYLEIYTRGGFFPQDPGDCQLADAGR